MKLKYILLLTTVLLSLWPFSSCSGTEDASAYQKINPEVRTMIMKKLESITGPKEIKIELPQDNNDIIISVADFGADPDKLEEENLLAFRQAILHAKEIKASKLIIPNPDKPEPKKF